MATRPGNETAHKDILARMSSNAKETMDKMGDMVWMIKPGDSEAASLKQRIVRFAYEICSNSGINAVLALDGLENARLSPVQRKNIYLIFKEALNNAVKYSTAEKIEIEVTTHDRQLALLIKDDGKGFDMTTIKKGNGLENMQNRARELKGRLNIVSGSDNKGTTVQLIVPV